MKDMVRKKYFPIFFLLLYLLFIFYITLYTRSFSLTQSCNPDLFWSYAAWAQGKPGYGREILGDFWAAVLDSMLAAAKTATQTAAKNNQFWAN